MLERKRRLFIVIAIFLITLGGAVYESFQQQPQQDSPNTPAAVLGADKSEITTSASAALERLEVKGRAPRTGYSREQFGNGWDMAGGCDIRNKILMRDLTNIKTRSETDCTVLSGILDDPYTGKIIEFARGTTSSSAVQIDHVVALSDAWQKGAQQLSAQKRAELANDPLDLLAVDGPSNVQKGDGDAATWLPANKAYRCRYVARQIAVKAKYFLWVTEAERNAMRGILNSCPGQLMPEVIRAAPV